MKNIESGRVLGIFLCQFSLTLQRESQKESISGFSQVVRMFILFWSWLKSIIGAPCGHFVVYGGPRGNSRVRWEGIPTHLLMRDACEKLICAGGMPRIHHHAPASFRHLFFSHMYLFNFTFTNTKRKVPKRAKSSIIGVKRAFLSDSLLAAENEHLFRAQIGKILPI
jgi:hypothetical protein